MNSAEWHSERWTNTCSHFFLGAFFQNPQWTNDYLELYRIQSVPSKILYMTDGLIRAENHRALQISLQRVTILQRAKVHTSESQIKKRRKSTSVWNEWRSSKQKADCVSLPSIIYLYYSFWLSIFLVVFYRFYNKCLRWAKGEVWTKCLSWIQHCISICSRTASVYPCLSK